MNEQSKKDKEKKSFHVMSCCASKKENKHQRFLQHHTNP